MSSLFSKNRASAALLPGNRFFVRLIELEPDNIASQVSLAIETVSPFPSEQMLMGYVTSADNKWALAYAAHRRRFTPEESFAWPDDCQVVPEFLALLGQRPEKGGILVHEGEDLLTALAWNENQPLPKCVLVVDKKDSSVALLTKEIIERTGLPSTTPVITTTGELSSDRNDSQLILNCNKGKPFQLSSNQLDNADIRDADFLSTRRKKERVNKLLWNTARVAVGIIILSFVFEISAFLINWRSNNLRLINESRQSAVQEIESAQAISARITDMNTKAPLPLEMLAVANEYRPATVDFQRVSCKNNTQLEIEARTTNASDVYAFEKSLKERSEISFVATKDMRARDNFTTFSVTITFKPEALRKGVKNK